MDEMELDIVSQLLEMDDIDMELNNKENVNFANKNINSNDEKSEEEIKNELELVKKRMDQLQKQLEEKKLQENLQKTSSGMSKNEKQILNVSKTNKLKDIGIDVLIPESTSILNSQANNSKEKSEIHSGETDTSDDEMNVIEKSALSETGQKIKNSLNKISKLSNTTKFDSKKTWITNTKNKENKSLNTGKKVSLDADKTECEIFSDLRIINPLVSSSVMKSRMEGRKFVRMSAIRLHMRGNDIEGDWVTIGVIVKKVPTNTSKKGNKYSIWKMSDLKNCEKIVNFFLFGEVHKQHWKTSIGTVVGFLNANIMTDRNKNSDEISFSVDHPGKVMMIGTSKDLGQCKSKRKDGASCQNIVNLIQGDYCQYHVKQEYKKLSGRRMDLQSSYSGTEPKCLKKAILNKQPIFYGGQMFVSNPKKPTNKKNEKKGQLTLDNLKLQKQAEHLMKEEKYKCLKIKNHNPINYTESDALNNITSQSSFLKQKLSIPTVGSRNFLKYLAKDQQEKEMNKSEIKSITPKELLKLHKQQLDKSKQQMKLKNNLLSNSLNTTQPDANIPCLGRDINPGEFITLDLTKQKVHHSAEIAKFKAINIIQEQGKINPNNPNAVRKKMSPSLQEKVKKRLLENNTELKNSPPPEVKRSRLSDIDLNSEKVQEILNRKSSHAYEVELEDLEKQDKYFNILEKKEQMEDKMQSITEITCDVISCKKCMYTAYQPSELCKTENHPLKRHKAIKRFFRCSDCNHRTFAFTKLPKKSCRKCGGSNFERTSMMKPKEGIKLSHENLLIRGIEEKFL